MQQNTQYRVWLLAALLLAASFGLPGCSKKVADPDLTIDLSGRFSAVDRGSSKNFEKQKDVVRKGHRRESLVLIAPAVIRASLSGISGRTTLQYLAAPVFDVGDGFLMTVFLRRAGARHRIGDRYFDPGRKVEDRDWIPIAIPLEVQQGDQLEIEASGGPQGDLTADWLALSDPKLVAGKPNPR